MCGIFGAFSKNNSSSLAALGISDAVAALMASSINHRGPDHTGMFSSENCLIGNVRLSIVDLAGGNQPFYSEDKRYVLVQNGEIYNFPELKSELLKDGYSFQSNCDTEVLMRLFEKYHLEMLPKLNGMFAIAVYDRVENILFLIRDRLGVKPLYYYEDGNKLLFASEIKALFHAGIPRNISPEAINQYLFFNYVPPPKTIFQDIYHVCPGSYLTVTADGITHKTWWTFPTDDSQPRNESSLIDELNSILFDATSIRLRCDVPYGAFLSGGVDSSSVVGMMNKIIPENVNTFSIGFEDSRYDETPFSDYASTLFKTNHISKICKESLISLWPSSTWFCDQPHGDLSFLPTYEVSKLASHHVKVVLTGDGADELFAGYSKYLEIFKASTSYSNNQLSTHLNQHLSLLSCDQRSDLYTDDFKKKILVDDPEKFLSSIVNSAGDLDCINKALYVDTKLLLPGNNLVKPDRMTMANSIEARSPFLDYRMVEFAFSLPGEIKLKDGTSKYIMKQAFAPLITNKLAYRKKQMFTVPVGDWFKSSLSSILKRFLLCDTTLNRNIFKAHVIEQLVFQHCSGKYNHTRLLRALVSLELWMRIYIDTLVVPSSTEDPSIVKNSFSL